MAGYAITNLRELEDQAPKFGHSDDLEARFARKALDCERSGLSLQRLKPNRRSPFAHRHQDQEEIYVLLSGSARVKLGDEAHELRAWDAVRVSPQTTRAFQAGPEGAEILACGAGGEADRGEVEPDPHWWGD